MCLTNCSTIMGILLDNRRSTAVKVQEVLTKYGCIIRMRLGLHDPGNCSGTCSNEGLIILQLCAPDVQRIQLQEELNSIKGVKAKMIELSLD